MKSEIEQAESSLSGKRIQGDQFVDELERMRDDAQEAQVKLKTLERSLSEFDENEAAVQWMMDIGSGKWASNFFKGERARRLGASD